MKNSELNYNSFLFPEYVVLAIKNRMLHKYIDDYGKENKTSIKKRLDDAVFLFDSNPVETMEFVIANYNNVDNQDFFLRSYVEYADYTSLNDKYNNKMSKLLEKYLKDNFERDALKKNIDVFDLDFDSYSSKSIEILNGNDDSKKEAILERQNKYKVDCLEIGFEPIINCDDIDDIVAFKEALKYYKKEKLIKNSRWGKRIKKELKHNYSFVPMDIDLVDMLYDRSTPAATYVIKGEDGVPRTVLCMPLMSIYKYGDLDRVFYHELRHVVESSDKNSGLYNYESGRYEFINEIRTEMHALDDCELMNDFTVFGRSQKGKISAYEKIIPEYYDFFYNYRELFDKFALFGNIDSLELYIDKDKLDCLEEDIESKVMKGKTKKRVKIKKM